MTRLVPYAYKCSVSNVFTARARDDPPSCTCRRSTRSTRSCRVAAGADPETRDAVRAILDDVLARGDEAVREYTRRFDGVDLAPAEWELDAAELAGRAGRIDPGAPDGAEPAVDRVRAYHEHQREPRVPSDARPTAACSA